jgi:hypothetical protein
MEREAEQPEAAPSPAPVGCKHRKPNAQLRQKAHPKRRNSCFLRTGFEQFDRKAAKRTADKPVDLYAGSVQS